MGVALYAYSLFLGVLMAVWLCRNSTQTAIL